MFGGLGEHSFSFSPTSVPLVLRGGKKSLKKQRQRNNSLDKIPSCTKLVGSSVQAKSPYLVTGNGTISRKTGSKKPNPTRLLFLFYFIYIITHGTKFQ
jgi:hypothetical protein